ncbi:hypothetical protein F383_24487 [Gossypium arboreum]|uniref:Uncharacterized protein n=1 Tax=Gossypium arboreum TaxID=29729 RepID=A0A0B0MRC4_GOSAR|nr:hypothetical protein F383_24487 [Gossypium arboreum]
MSLKFELQLYVG